MSRTIELLLLPALLVLGLVPAAGAMEPEPDLPLRSFTVAADCTEVPGRLSVDQRSAGPDRSRIEVRGTGLPQGLVHGQIHRRRDGALRSFDPRPPRFRYETSVAEPLTSGRVEAMVWSRNGTRRCAVSGSWRPRFVYIGASTSASFDAKLWKGRGEVTVDVNDVPCRGTDTVGARVVLRFQDRTVRDRLGPYPCRTGAESFSTAVAARRLPMAMQVVSRSGQRSWEASYRLVFNRSARLVP